MDDKEKLEQMIASYLLGELPEPEKTILQHRLETEPHLRKIFDEFSHTIRLMDLKNAIEKINIDDEWKTFETSKLKKAYPDMFSDQAERYGDEVLRDLKQKHLTRRMQWVAGLAIAASLFFAISWGLNLFSDGQSSFKNPVTDSFAENAKTLLRYFNNTGNTQQIILPDSTKIHLFPGSEITIDKGYNRNDRLVLLSGKADFNVAKNRNKPFTVTNNGIATTALGTFFTVDGSGSYGKVWIKLHEGSIVISGTEKLAATLTRPYYLQPGDEFVYEKNQVIIHKDLAFGKRPGSHKAVYNKQFLPEGDQPVLPDFGKGSWYMFNNEKLGNVLDQLQSMFNTTIAFKASEIDKIYFIGTFSKTDSLENILQQIAKANSLLLLKTDSGFSISK